MKILFVDDRPEEIRQLCRRAGVDLNEIILLLFEDANQVIQVVAEIQPQIVVIGHGQSREENGDDVVRALRSSGYSGMLVGNSGGGAIQWRTELDAHVNRRPDLLEEILRKEKK